MPCRHATQVLQLAAIAHLVVGFQEHQPRHISSAESMLQATAKVLHACFGMPVIFFADFHFLLSVTVATSYLL